MIALVTSQGCFVPFRQTVLREQVLHVTRLATAVPKSVYLQMSLTIFSNRFLKRDFVFRIFQSIKKKKIIPVPREEF